MAIIDRISSLDDGYVSGDLSLFPESLDDKDVLFEATNNSSIALKQTLTYNGKIIVVEDTSSFPEKGELRIGPTPGESGEYELVYYNKKTRNTFQELKRGYAGSKTNYWPAVKSWVSNAVVAEHHNAIKDAIINIETDLGVKDFPEEQSLNGILKKQEIRFLAPKPLFRAYPIKGTPSLKVRFQNFTTGHIARFLWDFGDGNTVKLNVVTTTGAQGVVTKTNYITVDTEESLPFFYVESIDLPYSIEYSNQHSVDPKEFVFVDQTNGDIVQRNWIFGDGETYTEQDPDIHEISHIYSSPGSYIVTELVQFSNGRLKKFQLPEPIVVI